jgi:polyhydroxyalkanoate synthesis repressor PhaR
MLVKKYGNRRLYDTEQSRYVRLDEVAERIRAGADVRVVDAKTDADLTAPTLAQIIFEDRNAARLLPVPLLVQLIRLGDDALGEFLGRYVSWAMDLYLQARQGPGLYNPFLQFLPGAMAGRPFPSPPPPATPSPEPAGRAGADDVGQLRREVEALKKRLRKPRKKR